MKTSLLNRVLILLATLLIVNLSNAQFGKADKVKLPETYDFDYEYKLKMTHKKDAITLDYYLKEGAEYFGFNSDEISKSNPEANMFMVMDTKLKVMAMFMEMMGKKIVQKSKMKASDFDSNDEDLFGYDFKQIDSKTINGYECEGYVSENDKHKITFYITDDVPVSFNQIFGSNVKNLPKGFNPEWMKKYAENGLMMEMIFEDKKKSKNSMTMQCMSFKETDLSIDTTKYSSMMGAFGG